MSQFTIPTRAEVSEGNQAIFDNLKKNIGFVPNLYAYYAKSETALQDYLSFQGRKTSLSNKEKEVVNLVVSEFNGCQYCLSAHTQLGKMNGFTEEQILEIRSGKASFDFKLDALAQFTLASVAEKGKLNEEQKSNFFGAGYTEENLIDTTIAIGDKVISNYIHNLTNFSIDFPLAQPLEVTENA
ncbi:carboxymuconolactone decarboxylase family protein [Flammeovirga pectinis]|uniref:Carboxymuconolactone decarboxylase family protein n=1 Tax=Flammeovirga pectinis TaxID=2494373 RepID=A0A3Q9FTS9_9BACT|nr:carboxymuconolactone decarboxylase family protein [Flammeovirga pectinis]AZQ64289.1 carboxymuconolactone decarboxylase family protein [Flammeovirga pectinis]